MGIGCRSDNYSPILPIYDFILPLCLIQIQFCPILCLMTNYLKSEHALLTAVVCRLGPRIGTKNQNWYQELDQEVNQKMVGPRITKNWYQE